MSYRSMLRIQKIVCRSIFVLMSSVVALTGVVTPPASAQPVQVADWRQSISKGVGKALDRAPNGDYVVVGIESLSPIDPTYGTTMTLQRYTSGGQPAWSQPVRVTETEPYKTLVGIRPYHVVVDADGNSFVIANEADKNSTVCALNDPTCIPGQETLFNAWWVVQKYSPAGERLWQRRELKVRFMPVRGVVDPSGDLYVAFDPNSGGQTAEIQRLSGATGETLWTAKTPDGAKPGALALSSTGTVLLAGASSLGLSINEFRPNNGSPLTRTVYADAAGYYVPGMAVRPQSGEIAFTGKSADGLFLGLESSTRQTQFAFSTTPGAQGRVVAMDDANSHVVVAGTVPGSTGTNWLLLRYKTDGVLVHAPVVIDRHASAIEEPLDLIVGGGGTAYITGAAGPATSTNTTQAVTVQLASTGTINWIASESAGVRGMDAALALDGSVAVLTAGDMSLVHYPVVQLATPTALTLSPTKVRGGNAAKGTVIVSASTGAVVKLTSSNPTIVSVPSTVTVPGGETTASFAIQTSRVKTDTAVAITTTANGVSTSVILKVTR